MEKKINKGAIVSAQKSRQRALDNYYKAPNHCQHCKKVIKVLENQKIREVKLKKFCDHNCYSKNNVLPLEKLSSSAKYVKRIPYRTTKNCNRCNKTFEKMSNTKFKKCVSCRTTPPPFKVNLTKKELFSKAKNWQSARTTIRRQAEQSFNYYKTQKSCFNCGYDKHIEIAHIKSVSSFSDETIVDEINHPDNLIGLCPNCHWEFDNGLLNL